MSGVKVFETEQMAIAYAIAEFGALQVDMGVRVALKIGPTVAKHLGTKCGWGVDCDD